MGQQATEATTGPNVRGNGRGGRTERVGKSMPGGRKCMAGPEEDPEQFPGEVHMVPCGER